MTKSPQTAPPSAPETANPHGIHLVSHALRSWWHAETDSVDRSGVVDRLRAESSWSGRYGFMICMSAGIAILGLILSSPAVVIGAMLLSPLMGPIIAIGFALAIGDANWLRQASKALAIGTVIAIAFTALIVLASPLQTVTPEIAARTRPNLFDLLIALFSALAGAYAMIRGRGETIVGVAIATALMPPLAVVGFGLATWNWTVFGGAAALFFTNLVTIALSATVMARLYRFSASLSAKQSLYQTIGLIAAFVILGVPLALSLRQIAWETRASATIGGAIRDQFDRNARISQIDVDFAARPITVSASVLTSAIQPRAQALADRMLTRALGREIEVTIRQFRVGTGSQDAEAAELSAARNDERARMVAERDALAGQLALVAGVEEGAVFVDPTQRRATVRASRLPDAGLATYRALEGRVAKTSPGWDILLVPPALALPDIADAIAAPPKTADLDAGEAREATANADKALSEAPAFRLAVWAAKRVRVPVGVVGPEATASRVIDMLRRQGVTAELVTGETVRAGEPVRLRWLAPDAAGSS